MLGNVVTDYLLPLYTKCSDVKASGKKPDTFNCSKSIMFINRTVIFILDPIHAAAMMNKKRGLAGKFTTNVRVST